MSNYTLPIFNRITPSEISSSSNNGETDIIRIQGFQGVQGIGIGSTGTIGPQGWIGFQGIEGVQGVEGREGVQGTQGLVGFQGLEGIQGFDGVQGLIGKQGLQGTQGVQGHQGQVGTQGHQGTQGLVGIQGLYGIQGETGIQGIEGTQGLQGIQGVKGDLGCQGYYGEKGNQGTQGKYGPKGEPGKASDEFPLCVLHETSLAITSGDFIPFNRELIDTDGFHEDHTRIVPNMPGWYLFTWSGIWEGGLYGANASLLNFNLTKNGEIYANGTTCNTATDNWYMNGCGVAHSNGSTDYFELQISGVQDKTASRFQNCRFSCQFIRGETKVGETKVSP